MLLWYSTFSTTFFWVGFLFLGFQFLPHLYQFSFLTDPYLLFLVTDEKKNSNFENLEFYFLPLNRKYHAYLLGWWGLQELTHQRAHRNSPWNGRREASEVSPQWFRIYPQGRKRKLLWRISCRWQPTKITKALQKDLPRQNWGGKAKAEWGPGAGCTPGVGWCVQAAKDTVLSQRRDTRTTERWQSSARDFQGATKCPSSLLPDTPTTPFEVSCHFIICSGQQKGYLHKETKIQHIICHATTVSLRWWLCWLGSRGRGGRVKKKKRQLSSNWNCSVQNKNPLLFNLPSLTSCYCRVI